MMAYKTTYELHHNFAKLADESGFTFNTHKPRVHIDWNEIRSIDVDNLLRDRKFTLIETHINDILDCVLESEFDVRILDQGVVKMFRLAQLTIEYQQFCRHYLDRSVYVLRNELTTVLQDHEAAKRDIRERDDEIRKLKRKSKHTKQSSILYGHDNIANMILKTLSNNGEMYPSTSLLDSRQQYNKCMYCDKVFLNQLYLKSHVIRRHPNVTEQPQREFGDNLPNTNGSGEHTKLNTEIMELKAKLSEMETTLTTFNDIKAKKSETKTTTTTNTDTETKKKLTELETTTKPSNDSQAKSAELEHQASEENTESNKNDNQKLLDKIEEWKKEEHLKYSKEIEILRNQMFETINAMKEQETVKNKEKLLIEQLHGTIKEQSNLIIALKKEITENTAKAEKEKNDRQNELEAQILKWMQKVETQTQQYQKLVETLNQVTKEVQEARAEADAERSRAASLQASIMERLRKDREAKTIANISHPDTAITSEINVTHTSHVRESLKAKKKDYLPNRTKEMKSLEDLHQKAQALLNMKSSSSSSDELSETNYKYEPETIKKNHKVEKEITKEKKILKPREEAKIIRHEVGETKRNNVKKRIKNKPIEKSPSKDKTNYQVKANGPLASRSPLKVVRAKLTEEVNNRLIATGIDPLKNGLSQTTYNKKRMQLQQEQRHKMKKNPLYESTRNSILAFLDTKAGTENIALSQYSTYTPTKTSKSFSFASVMSNVKNKALSLVKHNEPSKNERLSLNDVTKKAIELLKTSSASGNSSLQNISPQHEERRNTLSHIHRETNVIKENVVPITIKNNKETLNSPVISSSEDVSVSHESDDEVTENSDSDHKYYDSTYLTKSAKSIDNLIKSPARRPSTANGDYNESTFSKLIKKNNAADLFRVQSDSNILDVKDTKKVIEINLSPNRKSDDPIEIKTNNKSHLFSQYLEGNDQANPKQAKGVLKNAPSTSSLNKKKVLFDMDAIQMKSISASPSQSTEKSDSNNEKYELGLINLDDDEWDISSIDNEPLKKSNEETTLKIIPRTSPKIAELKNSIESQLARRNETPSTMLVGGVDVLRGGAPLIRAASIGGSNTSLGSSVFDDTDNAPVQIVKENKKDDSDLDISEFSIDGETIKKRDSF